ncbi:MAG: DUF1573 domain-containing protein [Desulfobacteraceae bacterium]|nr:DUF1573 domain-containing protein [Desulfobacteraceae bacterium]
MKFKTFFSFVFVCCILFSSSVQAGDPQPAVEKETPNAAVEKKAAGTQPPVEDKKTEPPSAFAPATKFKFENAVEGTSVTHEFVIQNKGTGELKIHRVKTT